MDKDSLTRFRQGGRHLERPDLFAVTSQRAGVRTFIMEMVTRRQKRVVESAGGVSNDVDDDERDEDEKSKSQESRLGINNHNTTLIMPSKEVAPVMPKSRYGPEHYDRDTKDVSELKRTIRSPSF